MRKKTIRRLPKHAKSLSKIYNDLVLIKNRLKKLVEVIATLERELDAYYKAEAHYKERHGESEVNPDDLSFLDTQFLSKATKKVKGI